MFKHTNCLPYQLVSVQALELDAEWERTLLQLWASVQSAHQDRSHRQAFDERKNQSTNQENGEAEGAQDEEVGGVEFAFRGVLGILGEVAEEVSVMSGTVAPGDAPDCSDAQCALYYQNRELAQSCLDDEELRVGH